MADIVTNLTLTLLCRCSSSQPLPFSFFFFSVATKSQTSSAGTMCCCEWQFLLTHAGGDEKGGVWECVEREWNREREGRLWRKKKCTWINDVLEQVHKWGGPMFVSKDNAVLIGEHGAQFKCLGHPFVPLLTLYTHPRARAHTHMRAHIQSWYHAGSKLS